MNAQTRLLLYAGLLFLALAGLYGLGRWQGMLAERDALEQQATTAFLATRGAFHRRLALLARAEETHRQRALAARRLADSLRAAQPSGPVAIAPPETVQVDLGRDRTWRGVADAEHVAASECFLALDACDQQNAALAARLDSAETRLATQQRRQQCHILFVRCPSRTAMGLAGVFVGAVTAAVVLR